MKTYAAYYNNEIRKNSSSGGLFSVFATKFDIISGVAMTKDCYGAEMIRCEDDISCLRGSKYIQAKIGNSFKQVKRDLEDGKRVLFTGTGCQVNGLKYFLGSEYKNLTCVDIVCHGTPSPALWKKYAVYQESAYGKLKSINFRCKDDSLYNYGINGQYLYISKNDDPYMQMFLRNYCLRPSCYECYAKSLKLSDITIADFWGIENVAPEMADGKGTSLVIIRTMEGQRLFDEVSGMIKWKEVSYEDGVKNNPCEYKSSNRPIERDAFFRNMNKYSFEKLAKEYAVAPFKQRLKCKIKKFFLEKKNENKTGMANYGLIFTFEVE